MEIEKIKIGITGSNGFIGNHLLHGLGLFPDEFQTVPFERNWFDDDIKLDAFVDSCDVIVHLAALNRHKDADVIYETNTALVDKLITALERTNARPHFIISSSSQEANSSKYGQSKKQGREKLAAWALKHTTVFTGMIIPNVFGPFGQPDYNSVIATFCHKVCRDEEPTIQVDGEVKLIYVGDLVAEILQAIRNKTNNPELWVAHRAEIKVSEILKLLNTYKDTYQSKGEIPEIKSAFEHQLFNTYRCYMDIPNYFPRKFVQHIDNRGSFVEIIRLGIGGQVSFSTTVPGITRGNHFHTRKIERFAVIKGKALIQLRRIGTEEIHEFYLNGEEPAYVDMPIWYTHNIKNVGDEILYTNFWINEAFNPEDADTYFENV